MNEPQNLNFFQLVTYVTFLETELFLLCELILSDTPICIKVKQKRFWNQPNMYDYHHFFKAFVSLFSKSAPKSALNFL